jgi:hypothetical protein
VPVGVTLMKELMHRPREGVHMSMKEATYDLFVSALSEVEQTWPMG